MANGGSSIIGTTGSPDQKSEFFCPYCGSSLSWYEVDGAILRLECGLCQLRHKIESKGYKTKLRLI